MQSELTDPKYVYADILIALADADGVVDESEKEMLDGIFANMGLASSKLAEMWMTPRTLDVIEHLLEDVQDDTYKNCLLKDCYLLAYADDDLASEENRFIKRLADVMHVDGSTANQIKNWVQTAIKQQKIAQDLFGV